jgi:hypothetical protein
MAKQLQIPKDTMTKLHKLRYEVLDREAALVEARAREQRAVNQALLEVGALGGAWGIESDGRVTQEAKK